MCVYVYIYLYITLSCISFLLCYVKLLFSDMTMADAVFGMMIYMTKCLKCMGF